MENKNTSQNTEYSVSWGWVLLLLVLSMWILTKMSGLDTYQTVTGTIGASIGILVVVVQGGRWIN